MQGLYIDGLHLPQEECEPLNVEIYSDGAVFFVKAPDDIYEFKACECQIVESERWRKADV